MIMEMETRHRRQRYGVHEDLIWGMDYGDKAYIIYLVALALTLKLRPVLLICYARWRLSAVQSIASQPLQHDAHSFCLVIAHVTMTLG